MCMDVPATEVDLSVCGVLYAAYVMSDLPVVCVHHEVMRSQMSPSAEWLFVRLSVLSSLVFFSCKSTWI